MFALCVFVKGRYFYYSCDAFASTGVSWPGRAEISFSASKCNEWVVYDQRVQHEAAKLSPAEGCREGHKKTVGTLADKSVYYFDGAENWDELLWLFLQKKGLSKTVGCTQLRIVVDVVSVSLWFAS